MALLFLKNFTSGSYFTCRVLETPDQHYGKQWPLSKPGDEGDDGACDGLACDTEGTLALESRGSSSRPRSLSLSLVQVLYRPFLFFGLFSLVCKEGMRTDMNKLASLQTPEFQLPPQFLELLQLTLFSSVQSLSHVRLFVTPLTAARQASLSITNSRSLLRLMSIESVMPSNHLILCHPLLLPPSIFPSIRVFSSESVLPIRWPKY